MKKTLLILLSLLVVLTFAVGPVLQVQAITLDQFTLNLPFITSSNQNYHGPTLTGKVIDASSPNNSGVPGAAVCAGAICVTADAFGLYSIPGISAGNLSASNNGYFPVHIQVTVTPGQDMSQNFSLSRELTQSNSTLRIVLTWDPTPDWSEGPNDLDAHLYLTRPVVTDIFADTNHTHYGDCRNFPSACLEQEAHHGYGPETISISTFETATYYYGVNNYNQYSTPAFPKIVDTKAEVLIYDENGLYKSFTISPDGPNTQNDDFWLVFKIDAINNGSTQKWVFTPKNCIVHNPGPDTLPPACP